MPGGLNLSWLCLDRDSQPRHCQKVSLDSRENLNSSKKLVSTIQKSQSCLDTNFQSQKSWSRITKSFNCFFQEIIDFISLWDLYTYPSKSIRIEYFEIFVTLGVSICLDVMLIEISISTPKKYQTRRSRKSRRFSKVSLDDRDYLGEIEISRFCLDEVSQDRTF